MKTRAGFVSNSSTTSFMIYGTYVEEGELRKVFGLGEDDDLWDVLNNKVEGTGLNYYSPPYSEGYYIGISVDECRDDQTMGDFKKEVKAQIVAVLGEVDCSIQSDGWYDG